MATPILLVDDSKVCVEIVKSVETCDDQKALNMNPVLNENASLSSVNNALEADTNDDACESLVFEQVPYYIIYDTYQKSLNTTLNSLLLHAHLI